MVSLYCKPFSEKHQSSYVDALKEEGYDSTHMGDASALLSYTWVSVPDMVAMMAENYRDWTRADPLFG